MCALWLAHYNSVLRGFLILIREVSCAPKLPTIQGYILPTIINLASC